MSRPVPILLTASRAGVLLCLAIPLYSVGAESCPLTLTQDALTVRAPTGWHGYAPSFTRLTGFGLMGGDPQSMTYLKPAAQAKTKTGGVTTWKHSGEKWLYCTYDDSSVIQISKRLDDRAAECTIHYTESRAGMIEGMNVECTTPSAPKVRR